MKGWGIPMEPVSAALFAAAALGGLYLANSYFRGGAMSGSVAVIHGVAAATGLVLLLSAVLFGNANGISTAALVVFVVAALGGFVLASFHLRGQRHPGGLVIGHALIAVIGFLILLAALV